METIDPATNRPLPADAIQRILFVAPTVHIYNIPPLTSTKGHVASTWTTDPTRQIFTARLRILETAIPKGDSETVKTDILLEDPSSGDLFAAAPYTNPNVVEQVLDSSRFFAVVVQDGSGRKAVLGIGFEERAEAFDFSVALQEARKTLGLQSTAERKAVGRKGLGGKEEVPEQPRDFSLKEGQTIMVNIGGRVGKGRRSEVKGSSGGKETGRDDNGGFSLHAPSTGGGLLPPPPSAQEIKEQKRISQTMDTITPGSIEDLGFDDGEFGEFQ